MAFRMRGGRACAAVGALLAACVGMQARGQCVGYSIVGNSPGTYQPGTTDIGLYADDGTAPVTFPFPISFFGTQYTSGTVCTNGNLQFSSSAIAWGNNCLPTATIAGPAIFPFWDDLYTVGGGVGGTGTGIFTDVTGASPSRTFVIEWRTGFCCTGGAPLNTFEIKFYESQDFFDVLYSTPMSDRSSATIGCQNGPNATDPFVQYVCNAAGPTAGTGLRFSCLNSATAGACCNPQAGTCGIASAASCIAPNTFSGIGTTCPANCPQSGACCNTSTGVCAQTGAVGCAAPNTFGGVGVACTPNPCLGACCDPSTGLCTVTASGACTGGTWQGGTTGCTPNPCPQPPSGGCCVANIQSCVETNRALCAQQGGTYSGDNTTCATASCPFGACCLPCIGCFMQTSGGCTAVGGAYSGDGSACGSGGCNQTATNLLTNGDFESGSFSGWSQFGDLGFTAVNTGPWVNVSPHGGTFEAHFGPTVAVGGIEQSITANAGDHVTIGFWYANLDTNNSFAAIFDGQTLVRFVNDTAHTNWTLFVFSETVVNANPTLRFETFNPPSYVMLDDITVCQAPISTTGVCCRGSTCNTTVPSAAACTASLIAGQLAGARFTPGSACNASVAATSPCCYADYNKVSGITVQDIFDFLNDWFASSVYANTGGTGAPGPLAVQNIFDFLNAWFGGGCS